MTAAHGKAAPTGRLMVGKALFVLKETSRGNGNIRLCRAGFFGNDVDDSRLGVISVLDARTAVKYLYPLNIGKVNHVPVHVGSCLNGIESHAVNDNQYLSPSGVGRNTPHGDIHTGACRVPCHPDAGHGFQHLGYRCRPRSGNVISGDDRNLTGEVVTASGVLRR